MGPFEFQTEYGLPKKPVTNTQAPYSLEYLDEQAKKKSLLPKIGMRDASAYSPIKVDTSSIWKGNSATQSSDNVNDKIAFNYGGDSVDKQVPKSLRAEQIAKAGIFAGTSLGELGLINKIKNIQMRRSILSHNAIQTSVMPATDMPSEVLNQRTNEISRIRAQYKGSDPSSELISQQMAAASRGNAMYNLAAERGKLLVDERRRVAGENAANQVRAGENYNQIIANQQALNDYKTESLVNAAEHKKKLLSQVGTQLTDNLETNQAYNTNTALIAKQNELGGIQTQYNQKAQELSVALNKGDYDSQRIIREKMQSLMNQYNNLVKKDYAGTYWTKSPYLKNGGKLISRI